MNLPRARIRHWMSVLILIASRMFVPSLVAQEPAPPLPPIPRGTVIPSAGWMDPSAGSMLVPPGSRATPTLGSAETLRRDYQRLEEQAQATADRLRALQERRSTDRDELESLRQQLRREVASAFAARQQFQQAQIAELQQRTQAMQQLLAARWNLQEQIVDQRLEALLKIKAPRQSNSEPLDDAAVPTGKRLIDAVREFNERSAQDSVGKEQPPLTDDEVVASLRWRVQTSAKAATPSDRQLLDQITEQRVMPPAARLAFRSEFKLPDEKILKKWTIELHGIGDPEKPLVVREQLVAITDLPGTARSSPQDPLNPNSRGTGNRKARPLSAVIHEFNQSHSSNVDNPQPPLTLDEVLAGIHWWGTRRGEVALTNGEFEDFLNVAETRELPPGFDLEVLTDFRSYDRFIFDAWSIRLVMRRAESTGSTYAFILRDRWIRSREMRKPTIQWGTPAPNGLQAGIALDMEVGQFQIGERFTPRFFFRNSSKAAIRLSVPNLMSHSYYEALIASDDQGLPLFVDTTSEPAGPVGWRELTLGPGERTSLLGLPIQVGGDARPEEVESLIRTSGGMHWRLHFLLPNYAERDAEKEAEPLSTGQLQLETLKPKARSESPSAPASSSVPPAAENRY